MILPEKLLGRVYRKRRLPMLARLPIMLAANLSPTPQCYDVDATLPVAIPNRMFDNNTLGCCVMAARANAQERFYALDTGQLLNITDDEVKTEYLIEGNGQDNGLIPDDSFAEWRDKGWIAGGQLWKIKAEARIDLTRQDVVQSAIVNLQNALFGLPLPAAWNKALNSGNAWDAPNDPADPEWQPGSWGGHEVYSGRYTTEGVYVKTWGVDQLITWAGLAYYGAESNQGEGSAVVRLATSANVNMDLLLADLQAIEEAGQ